jgi:hypothetical protein
MIPGATIRTHYFRRHVIGQAGSIQRVCTRRAGNHRPVLRTGGPKHIAELGHLAEPFSTLHSGCRSASWPALDICRMSFLAESLARSHHGNEVSTGKRSPFSRTIRTGLIKRSARAATRSATRRLLDPFQVQLFRSHGSTVSAAGLPARLAERRLQLSKRCLVSAVSHRIRGGTRRCRRIRKCRDGPYAASSQARGNNHVAFETIFR